MQKSLESILVDIIQHELNLPNNYGKTPKGDTIPCVIRYAQNIKLFNTDKLQITIKTVSSQDYSNRTEYVDNPTPNADGSDAFLEKQYLNQQRMMQIDIYSRNNDARDRYHEVIMALNSTYALQQQDLYNFKLGIITNASNLSGMDGGSDINRFTITFNAIVHYTKIKPVDYYNSFQTQAYDNDGKFADLTITEEN